MCTPVTACSTQVPINFGADNVSYPRLKTWACIQTPSQLTGTRRVSMLRLHRPIPCSLSVSPGRLTTAPSWSLEVDEPLARPGAFPDCDYVTRPQIAGWNLYYSVGKEPDPCAKTVFLLYSWPRARPQGTAYALVHLLSCKQTKLERSRALPPTRSRVWVSAPKGS
jgi:hypothetical protein